MRWFLLAMTLLLSSCREEGQNNLATGTLRFQLGGQRFTASRIEMRSFRLGTSRAREVVGFFGGPVLFLQFTDGQLTSFQLSATNVSQFVRWLPSSGTSYFSTAGTITLTANSDTLTEGSFSATVTAVDASTGTSRSLEIAAGELQGLRRATL